MITDSDTIQRAIEAYAVMLNRPQWLDESRLLMQETVWQRLVKAQPGHGTVTVDHVIAAIETLLRSTKPIDVTVPAIIEAACFLCRSENDQVARMYAAWEAGQPILLAASSRAMALGAAGLDELRRSAAEAAQLIAESVLDGHEVEQMLDQIDAERRQTEQAITATAGELPAATEDAEGVISEWLHGPPAT
jgi:hypothetical protein